MTLTDLLSNFYVSLCRSRHHRAADWVAVHAHRLAAPH